MTNPSVQNNTPGQTNAPKADQKDLKANQKEKSLTNGNSKAPETSDQTSEKSGNTRN